MQALFHAIGAVPLFHARPAIPLRRARNGARRLHVWPSRRSYCAFPDPRKERESLSFFDEADEPRTPPRTAQHRRRPRGSSRRPGGGGGRRPPSDQQAIQLRRAVALGALVIVVILVVLGVHSCQISARNSGLKNYNDNVASLNQQSDQTGSNLFKLLSGASSSNATALQSQIDEARVSADSQLSRGRSLSVPDEVKKAQQNFVLALQMRRDGIANVARNIQPALGTSTSKDAVNTIATEMARFYGSDVLYKDYTLPPISAALHAAGIAVGGASGEQFNGGQFLPDIQWLTPTYVATQLHVSLPTARGKPAPGLHGHSLDSVSVAGTTLNTGSTNTIPASPAPTFTLHFTNGGQNTETGVVCKVSVSGTSVSGQTIVPQTTAGQSTTCNVPLSSSPAAGSYTVTATIEPVPGEKNTSNNSQNYPVSFQ
jgi:hypothetical protein